LRGDSDEPGKLGNADQPTPSLKHKYNALGELLCGAALVVR
jgi:hypothetical protein